MASDEKLMGIAAERALADGGSNGDLPAEPASGEPSAADKKARNVKTAVFAAVAVVSVLLGLFVFSQPGSYGWIIDSLDAKRDSVMGLFVALAGASAGISLIPGLGSGVADQIADLAQDLLIVLVAIGAEKYLLTLIGAFSFVILVPAGCVLGALSAWFEGSRRAHAMRAMGGKLALFGLAIFVVIPASILASNMIEDVYDVSADSSMQQIQQSLGKLGDTTGDDQAQEQAGDSADGSAADTATDSAGTADSAEPAESGESGDIISDIGSFLQNGFANLGESASNLKESASEGVSHLTKNAGEITAIAHEALGLAVDTVVMLIVTSCVIPLVVLFLFLWLANVILKVDVSKPMRALTPRTAKKAMQAVESPTAGGKRKDGDEPSEKLAEDEES